MASFFAFLASSSFVYIGHYGLTPTQYSFAFSVNAIGFIGASQFAARARLSASAWRAWSSPRSRRYARPRRSFCCVLTLAGVDSLPVLMVLLFLAFACLGLVIPSTMVLALEEHGPIAGMASALGGTLQMVTGGVMIVVVSLVFDGTPLPMVAAIALCALGALAVSVATLGVGKTRKTAH